MSARADVHVHSKYSDRPSEWILRRIGAPESFVDPLEVYRRARDRGMNFVTISDHNCIRGALEIAHLPGTFLSTEVTTYFPDGCKVHCLVLGITEEQFEMIQELRSDIYDFQRYVVNQQIVYSLAHPLFRVNDRLTIWHYEQLLLLFNRFEAINGTRDPRACEISNAILQNLTPEMLEEMADRHGLAPLGPEPWRKSFTAGSDDHSGIYVASAYTVTPSAANVNEFLAHLRDGRHGPGGTAGTSVRLAHSFYHIAYSYYRSRFLDDDHAQQSVIGELFRKLIQQRSAPFPASPRWSDQLTHVAGWLAGGGPVSQHPSPTESRLLDELSTLFHHGQPRPPHAPGEAEDRRTFHIACDICQQLSYSFLARFLQHAATGQFLESLQTLASLGPVALAMAPYLAAFHTQHKDEAFLREVAATFPAANHRRFKSDRRAWVTDTFQDVNGVSRTIRSLAHAALHAQRPLTVLTCLPQEPHADFPLVNFRPTGTFPLPGYEDQQLAVPPLLEVIEYLEREQFSEVIISTPGPLGLLALAAGRLLGLRVAGIYHTDFPSYVRHITEDEGLARLTWKYMQWFYGQLDTVFVPSRAYEQQLRDKGFDPGKLVVMKRGVDLSLFNPQRRNLDSWNRWQLPAAFRFLYVGRLSTEKNIALLLESFKRLVNDSAGSLGPLQLVVVGDGPLRTQLAESFAGPQVCFTGLLEGDALATAYASCDAFVFPSTTDTFGNVVLEAQASGLPVIVSNQGGPAETVSASDSGLVVDLTQPAALTDAMRRIASDPILRQTLAERGLRNAASHDWLAVLDDFWRRRDLARSGQFNLPDQLAPTARQLPFDNPLESALF